MKATLAAVLLLFATAGSALAADPPIEIPYRGLLERDGLAYDGQPVPMRFDIYDGTGASLWHDDFPAVPVVNGKFSVVLGAVPANPIPIDVFQENDILEIGVTIGTPPNDVPLAGRQRLLAVPYARRCEDGTPSGAVMFFTGGCPPGWDEFTAARGRAIVGLPAGGTSEYAVGTEITDETNPPAHSHDVPSHTHDVAASTTGGAVLGTFGTRLCGLSEQCNLVAAAEAGETTTFAADDMGLATVLIPSSAGWTLLGGNTHSHSVAAATTTANVTGTTTTTTSGTPHLPYVQLRVCEKR